MRQVQVQLASDTPHAAAFTILLVCGTQTASTEAILDNEESWPQTPEVKGTSNPGSPSLQLPKIMKTMNVATVF